MAKTTHLSASQDAYSALLIYRNNAAFDMFPQDFSKEDQVLVVLMLIELRHLKLKRSFTLLIGQSDREVHIQHWDVGF